MRLFPLILILLFILPYSSFAAVTTPDAEAAAAQIQVSNLSLDPAVLMPYDIATVTILVTNTGSLSVAISSADIYDKDLRVRSESYGKVGSIGVGNTIPFTFTIQAGPNTGIFYPVFSLDFRDANSLRYPFQIQVQDREPEVSILKKPETFTEGKKEELVLHIGNPRDNQVSGLMIKPSLGEHVITPTSYFAGVLMPDTWVDVTFNIIPYGHEPVNFSIEYLNGINSHKVGYTLPIQIAKSRRLANPILSNVMIETEDGHYRVTGDVTNSGLENANAVEVISDSPAVPVFPYKIYAVGALKPDDFSSFEVTFEADENVTAVPLITSFKDDDGNGFSNQVEVNLKDKDEPSNKSASGGLPIPLIAGLVVVLCAVVLIVWYTRRR